MKIRYFLLLTFHILAVMGCGRDVDREVGPAELPRDSISSQDTRPSSETSHNKCWPSWMEKRFVQKHGVQKNKSHEKPNFLDSTRPLVSRFRLQTVFRILSVSRKANAALSCLFQVIDVQNKSVDQTVADFSSSGLWYNIEPILFPRDIILNGNAGPEPFFQGHVTIVTVPDQSGARSSVTDSDLLSANFSAGGVGFPYQLVGDSQFLSIDTDRILIERTEMTRNGFSDARVRAVYVRE